MLGGSGKRRKYEKYNGDNSSFMPCLLSDNNEKARRLAALVLLLPWVSSLRF